MASNIDPTQPPALNPTTAGMRANMSAAKAEIEALQAKAPYAGAKVLLGVFRGDFSQPLVLPSNTTVAMEFNSVLTDTLGIYTPLSRTFVLPEAVTAISITVRAEMANVASGHGSINGTRSIVLPSASGMGVFGFPTVNQDTGGGILRASTDVCEWDHLLLGDTFQISARQTSGVEIYYSGSNGLGGGQSGVIIHLYG